MITSEKEFVHDLVAELLGLSKYQVIWYYPNAPRPSRPYATLEVFAEVGEAQEDILKTSKAGMYNIVVPVRQTLQVQFYGRQGDDVCQRLNVLARKLETPTVADKCFANGVAFFDAESVVDLTEVLDDANAMPRAAIDLFVRTNSEIIDDMGIIEQVEVEEKIKIDDSDVLTREYTIAIQSNNGGN